MNSTVIESLISGCKSNDSKSQTRLYEKYSSKFLKVAGKYCDDIRDREEVVNEAFIKIFSNINDYSYSGPFENWMTRIVLHTAIDKTREKSFKQITNKTINVDFTTDGHNLISTVTNNINFNIECLFSKLTKQQEKIMRLLCNGSKTKEIANIINSTEGNVRFQISTARKTLKELKNESS